MTLLKLDNVSLSFGGIKAVDGVSFEIEKGSIFSIIGPNGAGKSTIFNLISRIYTPDQGNIVFEKSDLLKKAPHGLAKLGIARTFQNIELFDNTTLLNNLLTAQFSLSKTNFFQEVFYTSSTKSQERAFRLNAEKMIDFFELAHYRHKTIREMPYGARKLSEIARALCLHPKLVLLDEPSSGLNQEETDDLSHWIRDIKEELEVSILLIDHNMDLISQVSDQCLAMAEGKSLATGRVETVQNHPDVVSAYLGDIGHEPHAIC